MDWGFLIDFLYETSYFLAVFMLLFVWATLKGRQAMINVLIALYLALLLFNYFPYTTYLTENLGSTLAQSGGRLVLFSVFVALMTWVAARVMPDEFKEKKLESIPKKFLLALAGTILVMAFSFNALPVTDVLTPGTPLQTLFAPEGFFFWWLMAPLVILFII